MLFIRLWCCNGVEIQLLPIHSTARVIIANKVLTQQITFLQKGGNLEIRYYTSSLLHIL